MSEIEDIIARAICNRQKPKPERGDAYDNLRGWAFVDASADAELRGFDQDSEAAIAALSAAGYVIVPKEPTDAMIEAGVNRLAEEGIVVVDRDPLFVWRAMLHEAEKP